MATEPAKSRIAVEPAEVAGDTVTEASISVERIGEPDPELADQMLLVTPNEMRAVYERLRLYYEQGIWSFGMVKR